MVDTVGGVNQCGIVQHVITDTSTIGLQIRNCIYRSEVEIVWIGEIVKFGRYSYAHCIGSGNDHGVRPRKTADSILYFPGTIGIIIKTVAGGNARIIALHAVYVARCWKRSYRTGGTAFLARETKKNKENH